MKRFFKNAAVLFCGAVIFLFTQIPAALTAQTVPPRTDELRSFDEIFPGLDAGLKAEIFRPEGSIRSIEAHETLEFIPAAASGIDLLGSVTRINPSYLAESVVIIPYEGKILTRLDAYNALGRIRDLKGRLYHSHTRDRAIPLFEEAARLESERKTKAIPDPPPARLLPDSETVYIRLKDANFGNSYYRGDMSADTRGVTYTLTNTRTLSYLLFPVMKEGKFSAVLYMEPLAEGMLVYSMAGADASDFIASMVDIPSAISKRLAVFIGWIGDGVKTAR